MKSMWCPVHHRTRKQVKTVFHEIALKRFLCVETLLSKIASERFSEKILISCVEPFLSEIRKITDFFVWKLSERLAAPATSPCERG